MGQNDFLTTHAIEIQKLEAQINKKLKEYELHREGMNADQFVSIGDGSSHFSLIESKILS